MTNYEAIKNMNLKEMAYLLYLTQKPFLDWQRATDEEKKGVCEQYERWLMEEVKNGNCVHSKARPGKN